MPRLATALVLLATALGASAQSSSPSSSSSSSGSSASVLSATGTATGTAAAATSSASGTGAVGQQQNVTVLGYVGAEASGAELPYNATMQGVWSTEYSKGTLTQGMALLQNSTATAQNQSVLGVFLRYNESTALSNANASATTSIPWIALISCDSPTQSGELSADSANSTLAAFGNATTAVPVSGTDSANSTSSSTTTQANYTANAFAQAEAQGAQAVLLYSLQQQSCSLNSTALNGTTSSLPIWTTPTQNIAQTVVNQFNNIPSENRYFNASLLNAATGNLTSLIEANQDANASTLRLSSASFFVLARLTPSYDPTDSNNGVVATIGRAPSSVPSQTASATGSVAAPSSTGGAGGEGNGGGSSAAGRGREVVTGLLVGVGALAAGAGLLL
ncbi:hypothetical protein DMC30DRAFT_436740 [Rhodotorula diobovata]|uniref:Uncharacterized protein n=1 Tax=Rhodotorula diobovata TaxID=5288 RepID=A0A5C5FXY0_9BASI|nr:hypothetical protein DMC30DRAFT_436740 [Rhodotorula diobovata]